VRVGSCDALEL